MHDPEASLTVAWHTCLLCPASFLAACTLHCMRLVVCLRLLVALGSGGCVQKLPSSCIRYDGNVLLYALSTLVSCTDPALQPVVKL